MRFRPDTGIWGKGVCLPALWEQREEEVETSRWPVGSLVFTATFHPLSWGPGVPSSSDMCRTQPA